MSRTLGTVVRGVRAPIFRVHGHQMVAHLVGGIAEHQHDLLHAGGDALQQQGEAVAAENGERYAHRLAAGLGADIGSDLRHSKLKCKGALL